MRERIVYILIVLTGCVVCQENDNTETQTYFPDTQRLTADTNAEEYNLEAGDENVDGNKDEKKVWNLKNKTIQEPQNEVDGEKVVIQTGSGKIRGLKIQEDDFKFLGIPFAEPPVGKLRLQPPVPVEAWSGVLEATNNGPACVQMITPALGPNEGVSEDCLRLNIFTKSLESSQAVMVWIHGGGYSSGSKDRYKMREIVDKDIVLVTVNYRLGAFGFLSFGNNLVSGNMGLKDQHLAMQWVQANIQHFDG